MGAAKARANARMAVCADVAGGFELQILSDLSSGCILAPRSFQIFVFKVRTTTSHDPWISELYPAYFLTGRGKLPV